MSAYADADVLRVMDALGCYVEVDELRNERYCPEHNAAWLSDVNACPRAERVLIEASPAIAARALREAATYWGENPDGVDDETPADCRNWLRDRADEIERT